MSSSYFWCMGAALTMMILDIITGFIGALKNSNISSSKMREGLFHKSGMVCVITLAGVLEIFAYHVPEMGISVPLVIPACVIIVSMELVSILENITIINPELDSETLNKLFGKSK